ncbi:hypothetical protein GCM10023231_36470 [Olivibacter ginsenosidimutans]|uniref:Uncharacterized protein n=1 Tax=Olivibacter ginsenosidimutans TaxID=1176537 RepID=A0ABP9C7P4_9SPHI
MYAASVDLFVASDLIKKALNLDKFGFICKIIALYIKQIIHEAFTRIGIHELLTFGS